ncbi:MAG: M23 family metallopeptidase [Bacteriovoracaceae bacterium]|nr:M23 family metallopeptidase [Bacteriovoracaceae bacterium]
MKDGKYVQIGNPYDIEMISKVYGLSMESLRDANPEKNFEEGTWIFIPRLREGRVLQETSRSPSSIARQSLIGHQDFLWPIKRNPISISSPFGDRGFGKTHDGVDIPSPRGTKIYAAAKGKVIFCKRMKGYGRLIIVDHGKDVHTIYAHNSKNLVRVGDQVSEKTVIALVGASGRATGNHLHFEVRIDGEAYDPLPFLDQNREIFIGKNERSSGQ